MKFWPITLHLELHFDSVGVEPNPWWIPFLWFRRPWEKHELYEMPQNGFILRCGIFGVHFCAAIHWYDGAHTDAICTWPDCGRDTNCVTGDVCGPQCRRE